jgi:cytochrome P450
VVNQPFLPRHIERFAPRVSAITEELLASYGPGDVLAVIADLANPLAYRATCEFIGMPTGKEDAFLMRCTDTMVTISMEPFPSDEQLEASAKAIDVILAHIQEAIAWKRNHMGDDIVSAILAAADRGTLTDPEAMFLVHTLFVAGDSSTVYAVALAMLALLTHRDQWELLAADPTLAPHAVEELLRYDNSIQLSWRQATVDYPIDDITIPAGSHVLIWNASANRDPERWGPEADVLDITRRDADQHLSFGAGPHSCLGLWLARAELQAAIGVLARRFPRLELFGETVHWNPLLAVRGPEELRLRLMA